MDSFRCSCPSGVNGDLCENGTFVVRTWVVIAVWANIFRVHKCIIITAISKVFFEWLAFGKSFVVVCVIAESSLALEECSIVKVLGRYCTVPGGGSNLKQLKSDVKTSKNQPG